MTRVPADFDAAVSAIRAARTPAELFGVSDVDSGAAYRALAKLVHPDRAPHGRAGAATVAFGRLAELWALATRPVTVSGAHGRYTVRGHAAADELADYLEADPAVVLKVVRNPTDNDLIRQEAEVLGHLSRRVPARHHAYLPVVRDSFTYREAATGVDRAVNVFPALDGFLSLATVRSAFPDGLDARDVAWMWRRLLVALGLAHRAGYVHGAVIPEHVLIHPDEHGLVLVNWCYAAAVSTSDRVPAVVSRYRDWYAPEITTGGRPSPSSDIYLATHVIGALMNDGPPELQRFARACRQTSPKARPGNAWRLLSELDELLTTLYGRRRFRPFAMPATAPQWPRQGPFRGPN